MFEGEEFRNVLSEQLREVLVEVRADGNIALAARILFRELLDHAGLFMKVELMELHGAGLEPTIRSHDQEA